MPFGITISKGVEVRNTPESARPQDAAERVRRSLNAALTRVMGEEAGVASAMLFNHKEAMSEDETAAFRTLGIAHVTAVSGLHVGILAAALLPLLRRFRAGRKARFVLLALFLLAYSWLTGFSAASLRASVMFLLGVGELLEEHRFLIENIDATIIAQAPKMRPHIDAMRENIAHPDNNPAGHEPIGK